MDIEYFNFTIGKLLPYGNINLNKETDFFKCLSQ